MPVPSFVPFVRKEGEPSSEGKGEPQKLPEQRQGGRTSPPRARPKAAEGGGGSPDKGGTGRPPFSSGPLVCSPSRLQPTDTANNKPPHRGGPVFPLVVWAAEAQRP